MPATPSTSLVPPATSFRRSCVGKLKLYSYKLQPLPPLLAHPCPSVALPEDVRSVASLVSFCVLVKKTSLPFSDAPSKLFPDSVPHATVQAFLDTSTVSAADGVRRLPCTRAYSSA